MRIIRTWHAELKKFIVELDLSKQICAKITLKENSDRLMTNNF